MGFSALVQAARDRLAGFYSGAVQTPDVPGGMDGDGHTENFVPALRDVATVGQAVAELVDQAAQDAEATAADRAASANSATAAAASAARFQGTSATARTPAIGALSFTTQAGKAFDVGTFLQVQSRGAVGRWAYGKVTAYAGTTVTIAAEAIGPTVSAGSDWNLLASGARGVVGPTGPFDAASMYDFNLHYGS